MASIITKDMMSALNRSVAEDVVFRGKPLPAGVSTKQFEKYIEAAKAVKATGGTALPANFSGDLGQLPAAAQPLVSEKVYPEVLKLKIEGGPKALTPSSKVQSGPSLDSNSVAGALAKGGTSTKGDPNPTNNKKGFLGAVTNVSKMVKNPLGAAQDIRDATQSAILGTVGNQPGVKEVVQAYVDPIGAIKDAGGQLSKGSKDLQAQATKAVGGLDAKINNLFGVNSDGAMSGAAGAVDLSSISDPTKTVAQQITVDPAVLAQQQALLTALQAQAAGTGGPSPAELLIKNQQEQNLQRQLALAASLSGRELPAAQRQIMQNQAIGSQQASQQAALQRAQEQLAAQQQVQGLLSAMQQQGLGTQQANQAANIEAARLNESSIQNREALKNQLQIQALRDADAARQREAANQLAANQAKLGMGGAVASGLGSLITSWLGGSGGSNAGGGAV